MDYSLEIPITERYNRKMWLDPDVPLPISQAVGLPLRGGFRFADSNTRSPFDLYKKQFGPRFGLAYQLTPRTVIRSGYGIAFDPLSTFQVTAVAGKVPGLTLRCVSTLGTAGATTTAGCQSVPDIRIGQGFPNALTAPTLQPSSYLTLPNQVGVSGHFKIGHPSVVMDLNISPCHVCGEIRVDKKRPQKSKEIGEKDRGLIFAAFVIIIFICMGI